MQIKTKIKTEMKRCSAGWNVTVFKTDIDFQIDKILRPLKGTSFFTPA